MRLTMISLLVCAPALIAQVAHTQDIPLKNWTAPAYWQPSQTESVAHGKTVAEIRTSSPDAFAQALVFVAMTPCRVADTRASQMFASPFGAPSLSAGPARSFPIQSSTTCSIPPAAQAYSFNVTVIPPASLGYLILWPTGQSQPNAVTLDDITGDIRNNAVIVPAGTPNGSISAVVNGNTDLVIDINGYYAAALGNSNTAIGLNALFANTSGTDNTASGAGALYTNTTGNYNVADGASALYYNTTGIYNTAVGIGALVNLTNGSDNTALGYNAGQNITTGNYNIDIGNAGTAGDSYTIRIGTDTVQTSFFAAGIYGNMTNGAGVPVLIDFNGQLGTVNSSRRYKEDIQDMDDASSGLMQLRPVTYRYQKPYADGSKPIDYGLIAEEVAVIYPDLVVKGADGQIETVQYHKLIPMLLNEVQKLQKLQSQVVALQEALNNLRAGQ